MGRLVKNKVVLVGGEFRNKGAEAMVFSTYSSLNKMLPEAEFVIASYAPADIHREPQSEFHIIGNKENLKFKAFQCIKAIAYRLSPIQGIRSALIKSDPLLEHLTLAIVMIDISGYAITDKFGAGRILLYFSEMMLSKIMGIPFVIYPQAMGPLDRRSKRFRIKTSRLLARIFLPRADLLIVRGDMTKSLLEEIGVGKKKKIHLHPDIAFLFEPESQERAWEILHANGLSTKEDTLVGVVINDAVYSRCEDLAGENKYVVLLCKIANYLTHEKGLKVVLIPHEFHEAGSESIDDIAIIDKIMDKFEGNRDVAPINQVYTSAELKAVIGEMDLIVTSRFHGAVASLSMAVPTIVIGWSDKYHELMKIFAQEKYVFDYDSVSLEEIQKTIDEILPKLEDIQRELSEKLPKVQESAQESAILVGKLLASRKK